MALKAVTHAALFNYQNPFDTDHDEKISQLFDWSQRCFQDVLPLHYNETCQAEDMSERSNTQSLRSIILEKFRSLTLKYFEIWKEIPECSSDEGMEIFTFHAKRIQEAENYVELQPYFEIFWPIFKSCGNSSALEWVSIWFKVKKLKDDTINGMSRTEGESEGNFQIPCEKPENNQNDADNYSSSMKPLNWLYESSELDDFCEQQAKRRDRPAVMTETYKSFLHRQRFCLSVLECLALSHPSVLDRIDIVWFLFHWWSVLMCSTTEQLELYYSFLLLPIIEELCCHDVSCNEWNEPPPSLEYIRAMRMIEMQSIVSSQRFLKARLLVLERLENDYLQRAPTIEHERISYGVDCEYGEIGPENEGFKYPTDKENNGLSIAHWNDSIPCSNCSRDVAATEFCIDELLVNSYTTAVEDEFEISQIVKDEVAIGFNAQAMHSEIYDSIYKDIGALENIEESIKTAEDEECALGILSSKEDPSSAHLLEVKEESAKTTEPATAPEADTATGVDDVLNELLQAEPSVNDTLQLTTLDDQPNTVQQSQKVGCSQNNTCTEKEQKRAKKPSVRNTQRRKAGAKPEGQKARNSQKNVPEVRKLNEVTNEFSCTSMETSCPFSTTLNEIPIQFCAPFDSAAPPISTEQLMLNTSDFTYHPSVHTDDVLQELSPSVLTLVKAEMQEMDEGVDADITAAANLDGIANIIGKDVGNKEKLSGDTTKGGSEFSSPAFSRVSTAPISTTDSFAATEIHYDMDALSDVEDDNDFTKPSMPGVRYDTVGHRWVASWSSGGRQIQKYFPSKKFGNAKARKMAMQARLDAVTHEETSTKDCISRNKETKTRVKTAPICTTNSESEKFELTSYKPSSDKECKDQGIEQTRLEAQTPTSPSGLESRASPQASPSLEKTVFVLLPQSEVMLGIPALVQEVPIISNDGAEEEAQTVELVTIPALTSSPLPTITSIRKETIEYAVASIQVTALAFCKTLRDANEYEKPQDVAEEKYTNVNSTPAFPSLKEGTLKIETTSTDLQDFAKGVEEESLGNTEELAPAVSTCSEHSEQCQKKQNCFEENTSAEHSGEQYGALTKRMKIC